jgi:hypothetical protein
MNDDIWRLSLHTLDGSIVPIVEVGPEDLWLVQAVYAHEAFCAESEHEREDALRLAEWFQELAEELL